MQIDDQTVTGEGSMETAGTRGAGQTGSGQNSRQHTVAEKVIYFPMFGKISAAAQSTRNSSRSTERMRLRTGAGSSIQHRVRNPDRNQTQTTPAVPKPRADHRQI